MGTLAKIVSTMGLWIRETGQAMDRLGSRVQGRYAFQEYLSRHRTIMKLLDKSPSVAEDAFIAPNASVIGDVKIGGGSSIWYGCVLRGDVNSIVVGSNTNIQDNTLIHVAKTSISGKVMPTIIGSKVTIGHGSVLHACTVEDESFVGMGATLLDGVHVEKNAMVAAGALVKQNTRVPSGEIWAGNPAVLLRKLTQEESAFFDNFIRKYTELGNLHGKENLKSYAEIESDKLLRKKLALPSDDYDSHLGTVREKAPVYVTVEGKMASKGPH